MSDPHAGSNHGSRHTGAPAPADEPKTPMWLPALGAALFLAVAVVWATRPAAAPVEGTTAGAQDAGPAH